MSRRHSWTAGALVAALAALVALVACGTSGSDRGAFDEDGGGGGVESGAVPAATASHDGGGGNLAATAAPAAEAQASAIPTEVAVR